MPKFKHLYEVKLEHLNSTDFNDDKISYFKEYGNFTLYIHKNVIEFSHNLFIEEDFIITTFTNGITHYNNGDSWVMYLESIQSKDDLFNFSLQKDIYDLDLDIIQHIMNIIKRVREVFYDKDNNLRLIPWNPYDPS